MACRVGAHVPARIVALGWWISCSWDRVASPFSPTSTSIGSEEGISGCLGGERVGAVGRRGEVGSGLSTHDRPMCFEIGHT